MGDIIFLVIGFLVIFYMIGYIVYIRVKESRRIERDFQELERKKQEIVKRYKK